MKEKLRRKIYWLKLFSHVRHLVGVFYKTFCAIIYAQFYINMGIIYNNIVITNVNIGVVYINIGIRYVNIGIIYV